MMLNLNIPKHIAIIMDGNGRWAKARSLPTIAGHRAGAKAAEEIVGRASEIGVEYITLFAFSSENWQREQEWVVEFMGLLRWYLQHSIDKLMQHNVRIKIIGDRSAFATDLQDMIQTLEERTKDNTGITVTLALSYGGRDDIRRATQKIASDVQSGKIKAEEITENLISQTLDTSFCPDPDLFIRTSGELRVSNYLLWQMAYTEYVFVDCFWPDFGPKQLDSAIEQYSKRHRRYGLYSAAA
ncbi:MAG: isoprenyl transferase [Pseudomonadota bacterium]|jgi:undecaprenyl diphosphate synthase|nr:isoprenyl transferase [Alphaproteobacteria bacterium]